MNEKHKNRSNAASSSACEGLPAEGVTSRRRKVAALVAAIGALIIIVLLLLRSCTGGFFDPNAQVGQAPYKTVEEVQAELDRVIEEGMFNISIKSYITFADGESEGVAYIENVPGNRYHMQVSMTLDATGEEVYKSGGIAPDSYVESITLSRDLDAGTYPATATFTAIDKDSLDEVGKAAAKVTLVVEN